MSYSTLIIGGFEIPLFALSDEFTQSYEEIAGISSARMGDGSLIVQRAWPSASANYKLSTTISGAGTAPAALDGINRGATVEVECAEHRRIAGLTTSITLPAGRRTGTYAPQGFAVVNGLLVGTSISITGNVATLGSVAGAQHYQVLYWPKFTGRITHQSSGQPWQASRRWTVTIEEI